MLLNAHDDTGAYQLHAGLFRLICENGLIVSDATLAAIKVPHFGQRAIAEVLALRYAEGQVPISPAQLLAPRRSETRLSDLFTSFNVVQEHLLRGELRGLRADGRAVTTRRVTAVSESVRLNKTLWALTEKYAARLN